MKKKSVLMLLMWMTALCGWAQKITVSGTVIEKETNEPVMSASVVLLSTDSTMVCGASSNMDGKFTLPKVKEGKYILRVTFVGYKNYFQNLQLSDSKSNYALGNIALETDAILLKSAEVTARVAQVEMKADTFVYNAGAYRVPEGSALEELVKKLPGAEVSEDGTIKINGKEVKKIMIDGKEFFDNDTKIAMKNLPTNMVERIKAYDRQSDYTRMTGIDDGEEETVLDLSVKKGMQEGWLMNADVGYGTEKRYTGKFMVNRFTDQLQLSLIGSANNVNDNGFPGGGFRGFGGGGGGGLVDSKMVGLNVTWDNGKRDNEAGRFLIGGNVRYSYTGTDSQSKTNSETFLSGTATSSFSNSKSMTLSERKNVNGNLRLEWQPDTMTSIMFRPNFSYSTNYSNGLSNSVTFNDDPYLKLSDPLEEYESIIADSTVVNDNKRWSYSDGSSKSFDGMLMVNRRLNSTGRNLTLRLRGGYSDSESFSNSVSDVNYFLQKDNAGNYRNTYTHQYSMTPSKSYNSSAELSYSEPIFKGANLQFSYSYQYRYSDSDRSMFNWDDRIDFLKLLGADLSSNINYFTDVDLTTAVLDTKNSQYATYQEYNQNATVMFRYNKGGLMLNAGVSFQPQKTDMDYTKDKIDTVVTRYVYNWSPRIDLRYKISETSQLRIRYNGRSGQPSMTNLLDVTDDSDPLNISKGNPGLKPSWTNSLFLFYNGYNVDKQRGWMIHANANMTNNSISTAILYDEKTGSRVTMPMNINGNWSANSSIMFNTAIDPGKYFNFSTFTNMGYNNSVGYISNNSSTISSDVTSGQILNLSQKSTTKSVNVGERLNLNFRNDMFEFGINGNINYQHARNALQENANLDTYNFSYGANAIINFPWNMSLATDIGENSRRGYDDASMNTNELIWNAQLSQSFLKENAATISVQWYDILQQRSNISRSLSALSRTDSWNNSINSYLMVHFIYRLNLMGSREVRAQMGGFNMGGGPGGGGHGQRGGGFGRPR